MTSQLHTRLALALGHARAGAWDQAHHIVQEHDEDRVANWIHAVVHRVEGDLGNARYWYARCGGALREELSVQAELDEIAAALERPT